MKSFHPSSRVLAAAVGLCLLTSCGARNGDGGAPADPASWDARRADMVRQLRAYGIADPAVLAAMAKIPRHRFIPAAYRDLRTAYGDQPSPIGHDQTISQPYVVAYMTERIRPAPGDKVLEIGTGSGYQAAVLAECGAEVYSIEIVPDLARHAETVLRAEGYADRVHVLAGNGYQGWPEHAPFDSVIVTCAPEEIPQALVDQLKEGGRMILPLGESSAQRLVVLTKKNGRPELTYDLPVRFVPMVHPPAP